MKAIAAVMLILYNDDDDDDGDGDDGDDNDDNDDNDLYSSKCSYGD
jgi:hypothetical protein